MSRRAANRSKQGARDKRANSKPANRKPAARKPAIPAASANPGTTLAEDRRPLHGSLEDAGIALGTMAVVTVVAELAGAANLGTALGIGVVGFGLALIYVLARRG